jgi:hypothetical protein
MKPGGSSRTRTETKIRLVEKAVYQRVPVLHACLRPDRTVKRHNGADAQQDYREEFHLNCRF